MKYIIILLFSILFLFSCDNIYDEVVEKYTNGKKKVVIKSKNNNIIQKITYSRNGDTLSLETFGRPNPLSLFENQPKEPHSLIEKLGSSNRIVHYYKNGNLSKKVFYKSDNFIKKLGEVNYIDGKVENQKIFEYYPKNKKKLKSEKTYKNGKQNGQTIKYYEDGGRCSSNYTDGKKDGIEECEGSLNFYLYGGDEYMYWEKIYKNGS